MRWLTSLKSFFFGPQSTQTTIYRVYSKSHNLQENPYFEKYADKIAKMQKVPPEEFEHRHKKDTNNIQGNSYSKQSNQNLYDRKNERLPCYQKPKDLNQIMKLEALEGKTAMEIEDIWKKYHSVKDGVYAVLPRCSYEKMHSSLKEYPTFLFPLPRDQGYEFIMCQFLNQSCYFTTLLNYQAFKENAPVCLTVTYFTEFKNEKGIVLMRGEFDNNVLKAHEAHCLTNQLQIYYGGNDLDKLELLRKFNKYPATFKHMDLISNFEYSLGK